MKTKTFDKHFWEQRYVNSQTGWDIGYASTPIKEYVNQLTNKNLKILVPGAGNGYEVEYLWNLGFKNVFILDFAHTPLRNFKQRTNFPESHVIHDNFFSLNDTFDLIIEQTFFCSLNPNSRSEYAKKMHSLLNDNGKLVGLLFNVDFKQNNPPFGGYKEEYLTYFSSLFKIKTFESAYNSIKPRKGRELFFIFEKNRL